jgi:hypothetical protein
MIWNVVEWMTLLFYGLIVIPITNMSTADTVVNIILTVTFPVWIIFFLVTSNKPRIMNSLLAPIEIYSTPNKPSLCRRSRHYHHVRHCRSQRHCSSTRTRTGCRFQRHSQDLHGGGGCGKRHSKFKWKSSGSTARKSGR